MSLFSIKSCSGSRFHSELRPRPYSSLPMPFWPNLLFFSYSCSLCSCHTGMLPLLFLEYQACSHIRAFTLSEPLPGILLPQTSAQPTPLPPSKLIKCHLVNEAYLDLASPLITLENPDPHYSALSCPTALIFIILCNWFVMLVVYSVSPWEQESLHVFHDCRTIPGIQQTLRRYMFNE